MNTRRFVLALLSALCIFGQEPPATLQVTGAVKQPLTLTAEDLAGMPRASLQTKSDGIAVTYEGVWLHEVLKRVAGPTGNDLRGKALASYVLAEGKDGYQVVFSLAEFDPLFTDSQVLLADKADGKPLTNAQGPFRLVAPKEKRSARSVRMLTKLDVVLLRK